MAIATPPREASEPSEAPLRLDRAPVDRLLLICLAAATLAYVGWIVALQIWPPDPQADARQAFAGFVPGSSQPPAGPGEVSPATAGEIGSRKLGTSHYWFGGGTPRPIAEDHVLVGEAELPSPIPQTPPASIPVSVPAASVRAPSPAPSSEPNAPAAPLGRLGLVGWTAGWTAPLVEISLAAARPTRPAGPN